MVKERIEKGAGDETAAPYGENKERYADETDFGHLAGSQPFKIKTHEQGDGDGHENGIGAPGVVLERIDNGESESRKRHDNNKYNGDGRGEAADRAYLIRRDPGEGPAVSPHRGGEDNHVMHCSGKGRTDQYPEKTGKKAKLRCQHGSDERACAGYGGKVMAE